jgi:hypothetical protein
MAGEPNKPDRLCRECTNHSHMHHTFHLKDFKFISQITCRYYGYDYGTQCDLVQMTILPFKLIKKLTKDKKINEGGIIIILPQLAKF